MSDEERGQSPHPGTVTLDRADALALLRGYLANLGVTEHYRGSPLIERVRAALEVSDDASSSPPAESGNPDGTETHHRRSEP